MMYFGDSHGLCALLKFRFEKARAFGNWQPRNAENIRINCPQSRDDLEGVQQILEEYKELIQEANFIMFSQFFFKESSKLKDTYM